MTRHQPLALLAVAAGFVAIAADLAYLGFVVAGPTFGSLNDVGNASTGILAGWLAWSFRDRAGRPAATLALAGSSVTVVGSWLVLSGTTGWLLAAFVSAAGFGLIGPAVIAVGRSLAADGTWPTGLAMLGIATGVVMTLGILSVPAVALRLDDGNNVPAWAWTGFLGWLGAFVLLPTWAIWLGRTLAQGRGVSADASRAAD